MKIDNRIWAVITAIVIIAVLAGGWFLGVSPQLDRANAAAVNEQSTRSQNDITRSEIAALQKQKDEEAQTKNSLDDLQTQIPTTTQGTAFIKQINALADRYNVTVTKFSLGDPTPYVAPVTAAAPATTSDASSTATPAPAASEDAATPAANADPVPLTDALVTGDTLVTVPTSVAASGSWENLVRFQKALQSLPRLFLVTKVDVRSNDASSDGGAFTFENSGSLYVSTGYVPIPDSK